MCSLKVRFSQTGERRGIYFYAMRVEVVGASGISPKIFVYHQSPAGVEGNTFAVFDHVASPVDFQEIPEDAASETVPWYRTSKVEAWFRNVSDMKMAKQMMMDDIALLQKNYDELTRDGSFTNQTSVEFSESGIHVV